ncbi:MAG: hypothetical protein D3925_12985, partial [Candidatus Electrothrix sp. AR5]|nr:hypothetical protein [Candidatus Electrothrix sp. AR5]
MHIQITGKSIGGYVIVLVIVSLLHVSVSEATEFYMTVDGGGRREHCDFMQIKANKVSCAEKNIVISYDLNAVKAVEIIDKKKVQFFSELTPRSIEKINLSNQRAREYEEGVKQIEQSKIGYLIRKLKSVESLADLQ